MNKLIYIVDDEKNIRELISHFLEKEGFRTRMFSDGDTLLSVFREEPADMLILDIMLPGTDGLTICRKIREYHHVPIIIVSARDTEADRIEGITLGGDDYLTKPFSPMELVARVHSLFRRIHLEHPGGRESICTFGDITMDIHTRKTFIAGEQIDLTPTELSLLHYLLQNNGRALSRKELLREVWQFDFEVDTRATDDVVKRLRRKIKSSQVSIITVWGYGFKLELEDQEKNENH